MWVHFNQKTGFLIRISVHPAPSLVHVNTEQFLLHMVDSCKTIKSLFFRFILHAISQFTMATNIGGKQTTTVTTWWAASEGVADKVDVPYMLVGGFFHVHLFFFQVS